MDPFSQWLSWHSSIFLTNWALIRPLGQPDINIRCINNTDAKRLAPDPSVLPYPILTDGSGGHNGRKMDSFRILIPVFGIATLVTGAVAATQFELKSAVSGETLAAIVVLGTLCTGGAFYLVSEGMKRLSAALAGTLTSLSPLLSLWLAHWILGEEISTAMFAAAALIIGGILVMVYSERNHENPVND